MPAAAAGHDAEAAASTTAGGDGLSDSELAAVLERIRVQGWAVVPGVIPADEVGAVREDMERVHAYHDKTDIPYILCYSQAFAPYLASERLLAPMRAVFHGQHIRMRTNKGFVHPPLPQDDQSAPRDGELPLADVVEVGALHADGPFIAGAPVRVAAPYPDTTMQMQTVWMLSDFTVENGGPAGQVRAREYFRHASEGASWRR